MESLNEALFGYPIKVCGERVWRTYIGGRELDKIHGAPNPKDGYFPEEWMLSTTMARNVGREDIEEGICYLEGSEERLSLKQLVEAYPAKMLGARHTAKYGNSMGVLIKLIDSMVRLPVQTHPDRKTAMRLFHSRFGKTECWHILGVRDDGTETPCVYLGFKPGATETLWKDCFHRRDYAGMLEMMHKLPVEAGETYIIRGGVPHAIGAGCFIIETQEPTDITIRLEKTTSYGLTLDDEACHQGLGFERMFECFDYTCKTEEEVKTLWRLESRALLDSAGGRIEKLVGYDETDCFGLDRITVLNQVSLERRDVFSCLYVHDGIGSIICNEKEFSLKRNDQLFIPAVCDSFFIRRIGGAPLRLFRFHGPAV